MSADGKNTQKLEKIENEVKKSTQTPLIENQGCFEDEDEDEDDQAIKNDDIKGTELGLARSSCADDILMKTLVAKYAKRLMDKLEKVAVNMPVNSDQEDAVVRLRKKIQRLLKDIDQVGGPSDSSTVLLNKYDCLRMAYYTIADSFKGTKRLPFSQDFSATAGQSNIHKNCEKLKKINETENRKKLDSQEKWNNCEKEKRENCENEKLENLMKLENQEKLNNCKNHEKIEKRENYENNKTPEKRENHEKNENLKNHDQFQNGEKFENLGKRVFYCEYCGRGIKLCNMKCGPKLHSDKGNCQKNLFEWKTFLKRRFFIYFPCVCCMCD